MMIAGRHSGSSFKCLASGLFGGRKGVGAKETVKLHKWKYCQIDFSLHYIELVMVCLLASQKLKRKTDHTLHYFTGLIDNCIRLDSLYEPTVKKITYISDGGRGAHFCCMGIPSAKWDDSTSTL